MSKIFRLVLDNKIPDLGCDKCDGGRIYHKKPEGFGLLSETCFCVVERESLQYSRKLFEKCNIPSALLSRYKLEEYNSEGGMSFEMMLSFVEGKATKNWLFIHGPAGTGKTYLSILIAQIALLKEKSVYFTTVTDLLDNMRPSSEENGWVLKKYCQTVDLLILDDIGQEKSSEWVRSAMYMIVNARWNRGLPTIFTSNYGLDNVKTSINEAVYSRIKGDALVIPLRASKDKRYNK